MNIKNLFPTDVTELVTQTDVGHANALLKQGLVLLLVYAALDGFGGSYAVYVLGRRAPVADRKFTDRDEFDQRLD